MKSCPKAASDLLDCISAKKEVSFFSFFLVNAALSFNFFTTEPQVHGPALGREAAAVQCKVYPVLYSPRGFSIVL